MIARYIDRALEQARYELLPDGTFAAAVRGLRGVVATGVTLEGCRRDLPEVVEEWLLVRVAGDSTCPGSTARRSESERPADASVGTHETPGPH
jgi:predicted RNase H-like HicB family nuclease